MQSSRVDLDFVRLATVLRSSFTSRNAKNALFSLVENQPCHRLSSLISNVQALQSDPVYCHHKNQGCLRLLVMFLPMISARSWQRASFQRSAISRSLIRTARWIASCLTKSSMVGSSRLSDCIFRYLLCSVTIQEGEARTFRQGVSTCLD